MIGDFEAKLLDQLAGRGRFRLGRQQVAGQLLHLDPGLIGADARVDSEPGQIGRRNIPLGFGLAGIRGGADGVDGGRSSGRRVAPDPGRAVVGEPGRRIRALQAGAGGPDGGLGGALLILHHPAEIGDLLPQRGDLGRIERKPRLGFGEAKLLPGRIQLDQHVAGADPLPDDDPRFGSAGRPAATRSRAARCPPASRAWRETS